MQESNGSIRMLTEKELKIDPRLLQNPKVLNKSMYFKIKRCYFRLTEITSKGIKADGVSRREYFENRR